MFERYTERARRVIFFARYEASKSGSASIESGHLLLGLLREDKNVSHRFLPESSDNESIRNEVVQRLTLGPTVSTSIDLPLTDECKQILDYAAEEAERLEHRHIGTEHLLLGMLRLEKCVAAEILMRQGMRLASVRDQLSKTKGANVLRSHMHAGSGPGLTPEKHMVPDESTARRIAEAVWLPAFGAELIARQRPVVANLEPLKIWRVTAGSLFAIIRSADGQILSMGQAEGTNV